MDEHPAPPPLCDDIAEFRELVERLLRQFGLARLEQLADLVDDVSDDTGFGDVKAIITDGRVQRLKAEKSYE